MAFNHPKAKFAQDILYRYGIDGNAKANGVLLKEAYHKGLHKDWYFANVNKALQPCVLGNCLKNQVEDILVELGKLMVNGKLPY